MSTHSQVFDETSILPIPSVTHAIFKPSPIRVKFGLPVLARANIDMFVIATVAVEMAHTDNTMMQLIQRKRFDCRVDHLLSSSYRANSYKTILWSNQPWG
jgi:hypothetical protein